MGRCLGSGPCERPEPHARVRRLRLDRCAASWVGRMIDGHWLAVKRTDPRAFAIYQRHYSAEKNRKYRQRGNTNVTGPAATMVLLHQCGRALFVWIRNTVQRWDGQVGINCAVFRN